MMLLTLPSVAQHVEDVIFLRRRKLGPEILGGHVFETRRDGALAPIGTPRPSANGRLCELRCGSRPAYDKGLVRNPVRDSRRLVS